jgi:hypothetical protein
MWRLYLKSGEGIAVQSTFKHLADAFTGDSREMYIGQVEYIDYATDSIGSHFDMFFTYLLHKRRSFEHERELRALAIIPPTPFSYPRSLTEEEQRRLIESVPNIYEHEELLESGIYIPINLETLIERVYVPPKAEDWFRKLVETVMKKYGLEKEAVISDLDRGPL